jgi:hypothetical protein
LEESRKQLRSTFEQLRAVAVAGKDPGAGSEVSAARRELEPEPERPIAITSPTIARLYLHQGKPEQAESMVRQLLESRPRDAKLQALLHEIQQQLAGAETAAEVADFVALEAKGRELHCGWRVSEQGRRRANLVLGEAGHLTLRLAGFPANPTADPHDHPLSTPEGRATLPAPPGASLAAAAVGLLGADRRFVSIVHCNFLRLN